MLVEAINVMGILLLLTLVIGMWVLFLRMASQPDKEAADRLWKRYDGLFYGLLAITMICILLPRFLAG